MKREIGSDFWEIHENECNDFKFKNKYKDFRLTVSGRNSIDLVLRELDIKHKVALLPGYTCKTVIEAFLRNDFKIIFYNINLNLEIKQIDFFEKIKKYNPSIILVHSYFGINNLKVNKNIMEYIKSNKIYLLEDLTQRLLSEFESIDADYHLGSLRKWTAIPNGGILCSKYHEIKYDNFLYDSRIDYILFNAYKLKNEYMESGDSKLKNSFRKEFLRAKDLFEIFTGDIYSMTDKSKKILYSIDLKELKRKRIKNFKILSKYLNGLKNIQILYKNLKKDEVPLYFLIYIEDREKLQKYLANNNIYCPTVWPISHYVKNKIDGDVERIYRNLLCIPCDQRYDEEDMIKIVEVIKKFR